jgi:hypothetical protein
MYSGSGFCLPVDVALFVHSDESLCDGSRQVCVHCECFASPVERATHSFEDIVDLLVVLLLPLPDGVDELLTSKVLTKQLASSPEAQTLTYVSGLLLLAPKHLLNNALGRDTGVIASRQV